jgi:hypothetical protein
MCPAAITCSAELWFSVSPASHADNRPIADQSSLSSPCANKVRNRSRKKARQRHQDAQAIRGGETPSSPAERRRGARILAPHHLCMRLKRAMLRRRPSSPIRRPWTGTGADGHLAPGVEQRYDHAEAHLAQSYEPKLHRKSPFHSASSLTISFLWRQSRACRRDVLFGATSRL